MEFKRQVEGGDDWVRDRVCTVLYLVLPPVV